MKKYELTNETIVIDNRTLHRIKALKSFDGVAVDDLGGFVESESNLSHDGSCWIHDDACVFGNAKVFDDAHVSENACIYEYAKVSGNARVSGNAKVYGESRINGRSIVFCNAQVSGNARVFGDVTISNNAKIFGHARLFGDAIISDKAIVYGYSTICGSAKIYDNAQVYGYSIISGYAVVCDNAKVYGRTSLNGEVFVYKNAELSIDFSIIGDCTFGKDALVLSVDDFFWMSNVGSENGTLTVYKTKSGDIICDRGCFTGTLDEFRKAVNEKRDSDPSKLFYRYIITAIKKKFNCK